MRGRRDEREGEEETFSMANSSSALILISRPFSWASCWIKAVYAR